MIPTQRSEGDRDGPNHGHGPSLYAYRRSVVRDNGLPVTPGTGKVVVLCGTIMVLTMFAVAALLAIRFGG